MRIPLAFLLASALVSGSARTEVLYNLTARSSSVPYGAETGVSVGHFVEISQSSFQVALAGTTAGRDSAIYSGLLEEREGDVAPGTESGILFGEMAGIRNGHYSTTFKAALTGGPVGDTALFERIFHYGHADSYYETRLVLRTGMTLPATDSPQITAIGEFDGGIRGDSFLALTQLSGDVAKDSAVLTGTPTSRSAILRKGDSAPGTSEPFAGFSALKGSLFDFQNAKRLVIGATLSGDPAKNAGVWLSTDGAVTLIARKGDPAPELPGSVLTGFDFNHGLALHGVTGIVFKAALDGAMDACVWQWTDGNIRVIAKPGDPTGLVSGDTFLRFQGVGIDRRGSAFFRASLNDGTLSGLFLRRRDGSLVQLLRTGGAIDLPSRGTHTVSSISELVSFDDSFLQVVVTLDGSAEETVLSIFDYDPLEYALPFPVVQLQGPARLVTHRNTVWLRGTVFSARKVTKVEVTQRSNLGKGPTTRRFRATGISPWKVRLTVNPGRLHKISVWAIDERGVRSPEQKVRIRHLP